MLSAIRRTPFLLTVILAGLLAYGHFFQSFHSFVYTQNEYLNALFTQEEFTQFLYFESVPYAYPWQNLNLLTWGAIYLSRFIPASADMLRLAVQVVLVYLFLRSLRRFLEMWLKPMEQGFVLLLLSCHPLFWITAISAPSQILTLWLSFQALNAFQEVSIRPGKWYFSLLLLSASGLLGLRLAILLALGQIASRIVESRTHKSPINAEGSAIAISLLAILPALIATSVISLQSGTAGGPWLANAPTLISEVNIAKLFNGLWTHQSREWLRWMCNGFVEIPVVFPVAGLLAWLGLAAIWREPQSWRQPTAIMAPILAVSMFMFTFGTREAYWEYALLPLTWLLIYTAYGLRWILAQYPRWKTPVSAVIASTLCLLFLTQIPRNWRAIASEAQYYAAIQDTLQSHLHETGRSTPHKRAMTFIPAVFAHLQEIEHFYPLGLTLHTRRQSPLEITGGIRLDLNQAGTPDEIILYPDYSAARRKGPGFQVPDRWLETVKPYYDEHIIGNLSIYTLHDYARPVAFRALMRQSLREDQPLDWMISRQRQKAEHGTWKELPIQLSQLSSESRLRRTGMQWTFEEGYDNTHRIGLAFGFSPDPFQSANGLLSAGPGSAQAVQPLGFLESETFVIQGHDMQLMAKFPSDSTESAVCLAVYSDEPYGVPNSLRAAEHILDRKDDSPLMGDTFFYIRPQQLTYEGSRIKGWRVVREWRGGPPGWQWIEWSVNAWQNKQAVWFAADRSHKHGLWIDSIMQKKRPPGYYWNFEDKTYHGWEIAGEAFGTTPSIGSIGNQMPIVGFEGNYFVNTFHQGLDSALGALTSPPIPLTLDQMTFRIGGGNDPHAIYISLVVNGQIVLKATGQQSEELIPVTWDLTPWQGLEARIQIVDQSSAPWGHILVDDIRVTNNDQVLSLMIPKD